MKLVNLTEEQMQQFVENSNQASFYQLPGWGKLKKINAWKYYMLGYQEKNEIKAACLLLEKQTPICKKIFYSPRGFIIDYHNKKLLQEFTEEIKKFIINHKGFMLKIDPNVVYQLRDKEGSIITENDQETIDNLKDLGFKHFGFNKFFETMQPRFLCAFKLEDYETTLNKLSKTTKKHIIQLDSLGTKVKEATKSEIEIAVRLLDTTASRKKISTRPASYYIKMKECLKDNISIYLCYFDKDEVIDKYKNLIDGEEKNKSEILKKMQIDMVGNKLKTKLKESENKIQKYKQGIEKISTINDKRVYIGSLFSCWVGEEGITLLSGTDDKYKEFLPKYAMYNHHIKTAIQRNKKYINFYGITGCFDKDSKDYGIYEIKKGFNPTVIELIGEFDLILNRLDYTLYKIALKLYKLTKKK